MPATYSQYPLRQDVESLLEGVGITLPTGFDTDAYIRAAIDEAELITGWVPILAAARADPDTPVYTDFAFDPPGSNQRGEIRGGGRNLQLWPGFVSVGVVTAGGTVLAENVHYRLYPYNARTQDRPYTRIDFTYEIWGRPASVVVSGEPGYCRELKAFLWSAIRDMAASKYAYALREFLAGQPVELHELDVTERSSIELIQKWGDTWRSNAVSALSLIKRLV